MEKKSQEQLDQIKKQKKGSTGGKKKNEHEFKCGESHCGKYYHSYTAFYNHCKKSHGGIFPQSSLYNGHLFQGPSKNRGRPRIKKNQTKDQAQIQSLKTQNQLIQFIGILPKKKKYEEIIVYVANPISHLQQALHRVGNWTQAGQVYSQQLLELNQLISDNDLPDFYDPIEISKFAQKVDSYSFTSVYRFMLKGLQNQQQVYYNAKTMRKALIIWLTRNVSSIVLAEIIYLIIQIQNSYPDITSVKAGTPAIKFQQKQYLLGKSNRFKNLMQKYFQCIQNQHPKPTFNDKSQYEMMDMDQQNNQQQLAQQQNPIKFEMFGNYQYKKQQEGSQKEQQQLPDLRKNSISIPELDPNI